MGTSSANRALLLDPAAHITELTPDAGDVHVRALPDRSETVASLPHPVEIAVATA